MEPKEAVTRFVRDAWNNRQDRAVDALVHPDYSVDGNDSGPEAVQANIASYVVAFPDLRLTILDIVTEGDRVAARVRFEGTHEGPFRGIPATGRHVAFEEMAFWRIEDGKLREGAFIAQALSLRIQLGVLPSTFWHDPREALLRHRSRPA